MSKNFGDFQWSVYGDALRGITSRYPFDFESIERKAFEALPGLGVPVCRGSGRGRSRSARQCRCVFALWDHSPNDGQPARA